MKRLRLFFFISITISASLFSQNEIDTVLLNKQIKSNKKLLNQKSFYNSWFFFLQQEWDSTLVHTSKQLSLVATNSDEMMNYCSFFRGYSFLQKELFKEAEREFNKVLKEFYLFDHIKMFLGQIALEQYAFKKASAYFEEIKQVNLDKGLGFKQNSIEHNLGVCYLHLKKYDKAEYYLLKSTKAQEINADTLRLIKSYGNIATLYYEQYKDSQAIPYFRKAYDLSKSLGSFDSKRRTALNMAVVEENRKDYLKALTYRKEYEQWKDSLNDQNRIYETAQLEKKIAVEQKQKEVTVLQAENKVKEAQNRVFLYSGILLLILLIILFSSYKGKVKRNQIITAQKEDLDVLNSTKDKLFSIVSHDLRSSVNAIKTSNKNLLSNIETQNVEGLKESLQQNSAIVNGAYGLLDNLLNWALLQTKQSYFEMTELHLSLIVEHVSYNYRPLMLDKKIAFENSISKKTQVFADQESLKILLRNLLDNAIKFTKSNGTIQIYTIDQDEKYVSFVVEDSGIGMGEAMQNELLKDTQLLSKKQHEEILGTGLGLHLVKSMVQKNQGKFTIESELGKGTKMMISLLKSPSNGSY